MSLLLRSSSSSSVVAGAAAATLAASSWYTSKCQRAAVVNSDEPPEKDDFRVEVHLMDKISQKTYIQDAKEGIPSTLRILAIDLPELRKEAFSGECRLSHDKVFVDEIAPPKVIQVPASDELNNQNTKDGESANKKNNMKKLQIAQKALVKSLVQCKSDKSQQRVGVELLEASVTDLNRFELRKTHEFGNFKYDPGKYYDSSKIQRKATLRVRQQQRDDEEIDEVDPEDVIRLDKENFEHEIEAPWNQYAWAEELRLRITGQVPFGATMERSSRLHKYLFGHAYRVTVPAVHRFWEWPLPQFAKSDPDGIDGRTNKKECRAASKPHAVIANGAALQRMPSSLRLLQKLCKKADVPLFVIHDPRVWGGNTHQSLQDALKEMRATIKNRVINKALKQQGSSAFNRGRILGQVETEAKWQLKERTKRTKALFTSDASARRKSDIDWSKLDSTTLERKLVARGLIRKNAEEDQKTYSVALIELARRCIEEEEKRSSDTKSDDPVDVPTGEPVTGATAIHA